MKTDKLCIDDYVIISSNGSYVKKENIIRLHNSATAETLIHEVQHFIQRYEGFTAGSSYTNQANSLNKKAILNKDRGAKDKVEYDEKSMFDSIFGTKYTHVYQGTIFMPINDDYFAAVAATGKYPTTK